MSAKQEITIGSVWVAQDNGRWQVVEKAGPKTYRVVMVDGAGLHTKTFDIVRAADLQNEASRVR